jgi:hypothetical protein
MHGQAAQDVEGTDCHFSRGPNNDQESGVLQVVTVWKPMDTASYSVTTRAEVVRFWTDKNAQTVGYSISLQ